MKGAGSRCLAVLLVASLVPGCSVLKGAFSSKNFRRKGKAGATTPTTPRFVGTITLVNRTDGFALVDFGMQATVAPGTKLTTRTNDVESGELIVGDVHKRPFVIADIVKGTPQKGDQVFE